MLMCCCCSSQLQAECADASSRLTHSLMDKIKKFRSGGSDWGRDATAADVMDTIGARIVVGDLKQLCIARRCGRRTPFHGFDAKSRAQDHRGR